MAAIIQFRRDTAANWTSNNPTLAIGEIGYETDNERYKIGDGATAWTSLAYGGLGDIPQYLIDAKGDLVVGTADNTVTRLAVGSDGQHLVADSGAAGGVSWEANTESVEDIVGAQFVTNGSHSGISATYDDAGDGAIDLNVDDFTITLAGDLSGSTTITNLADATLTATIVADATELGTDTTGNYIATVAGTTNEVEVSGSGSETAAVTIGLPSDVTVTTSLTTPLINVSGASIVLEGATADDFETTLTVTDPTADRTITFPDVDGTVVTTGNLSASTEHIEDTVAAQLVTNGTHSGIAATYDDAGDGAIDLNVDDFTITLAGDLGGSATITDLADATLTATIQANSVALGTDTTGDYTASLVAGTGVTLTNNSGETATPTVAIGQAVGATDTPTFGSVTISNAVANATHAATKAYVDNAIAGLDWHEAVNYASAAVLPNTPTYDNGTAGVGATLTAGSQVRLVIDGANATTGNRVLVQDQATGTQNGIYDVTAQGAAGSVAWVLTRATDFDGAPTGEIKAGEAIYVLAGSANSGQGFVVTSTSDPHTVGTDAIAWTQFTGTQAFGAGTYLTISGNTIDHDNSGASAATYGSATQVPGYTVDAQGHLTAASNTTIAIPSTAVTDFTEAVQDVAGAQVATNGSHTGIAATYDDAGDGAVDLTLTASGASAASYGSATEVPGYTVDTYGRLTAASNTTIAIPSTAVTDFTEATQDVAGAQLDTNGSHTGITATYDDAGDGAVDLALTATGVSAAAYGSATQVPGYTVDTYGRLSAAANTAIAIPSTAVTDFTEAVQDVSGAQFATNGSHTGITATYDDAGDGAIDLALVTENVEDIVGIQFATNGAHTGITATYDDAGDGAVDLALISENVQDIVAGQLVTNGTHSGIAATYDDAGDGAIDLNVDDFTITLSGDIGGSVTITDLASATLATTIQANSIALGTDTAGNYLATLAGTANEVEVSGSGSETAAVTVGLPSAVTVTTSLTTPLVNVSGASIVIEGATANDFETTLTVVDPTADRTITLPDITGTVVTTGNLSAATEHIEDTVAAQLVTNGTHTGIAATYDDAGDGAIDLNVDDFTITLGGDLTGNVTITDLASATLTATVAADSVALGTDSTGNYIATVAGTANEVDVSGSGSETAAVTIGLPSDVTVTTSLTTPLVNVSGASIVIEGATANDFETTLTVTDPTADRTITLPNVTGTVVTTGNAEALLDGTTATTQSQSDASTKLATTAYVDSGLGALSSDSLTDADGDTKIQVEESADEDIIRFDTAGTERMTIAADGTVTITGDLTVNGTETTISSTTITVDDKNIEIGSVATPTDTTADGGGLTLKGATDKTWNWVNSTDAWTSSEHVDLASGKAFHVAGASVLDATTLGSAVVASSLTSVGTIASLAATDLTVTGIATFSGTIAGASPLVFEGATADDYETTLAITDPTADRTITFQDASGTVAYLASPTLTGTPAAPTAAGDTNTTQIATTAFVMTELGDYLTTSTATSTYAPIASPTLTGTPAGPTAAADTNTTQLATTAFVMTEIGDYLTTSTAGSTYAPIASPTLTGIPLAPTAAADTNTTQLATTAFVMTEIGDYLTTSTATSTYAPIASPTLTGVPAAPTAAADTNTTQIATTAYVQTELGALSSDSIVDADGDTKIQVEESADGDIIRFDTAGTERMTIGATGIIATTGTNITLANVASPTDLTADGTGFTVKGAADYTIKWKDNDELDASWNFWELNQNLRIITTAKTGHTDYSGGGIVMGALSAPAAASTDSGVVVAATATTVTLAAGFNTTDDYYNGDRITIYYGTGDGEERTITDYVGSTGVATVAAWTTQPDATSYYTMHSSWYIQSGVKIKAQKDALNEYLIKSSSNGIYTHIGSGNGGYVKINSYNNTQTALFDYGGGTLGYSGVKISGRLTSYATGTTKTASYTAVLTDESSYTWMNLAGANTFTIPPQSSVAFLNGTMMTVVQYGAGQTTIAAGAGVTLIATPGLKLRAQYSTCTIVRYTADTWLVYGDLDT